MKLYQAKNIVTGEVVFEVLAPNIDSAFLKAKGECPVEFDEIEEHPNEKTKNTKNNP